MAEHGNKWNKEQTSKECPYRVECQRFHIGHSDTLGYKCRAPDKGCKKEQKAAGQFFILHIQQIIKKFLVCKSIFCYIVAIPGGENGLDWGILMHGLQVERHLLNLTKNLSANTDYALAA